MTYAIIIISVIWGFSMSCWLFTLYVDYVLKPQEYSKLSQRGKKYQKRLDRS